MTGAELETLALAAEGLTNQEIARKQLVSTHTIKSRLQSIRIKLNTDNRCHAVATALRMGLIP